MYDLVLDVRNLQVQFQTDEKLIRAVDDISFQVRQGQTLGIVGESGSGKSVTSLAIMGLLPPTTAQVQGSIEFYCRSDQEGGLSGAADLLRLSPTEQQKYRGGQVAMIFQEPMSSLNPVYTIGFQLTEAILQHQQVSERQARWKAMALLQEVKLLPSDEELESQITQDIQQEAAGTSSVASASKTEQQRKIQAEINARKQAMMNRYPHELSGGQLQRVMIAVAISCNPTLLIADEPTTALDVTVQATILELLRELCNRRRMGMIFITHDLGVIAEVANQVAVMYRGKIVESGDLRQIFLHPQNPYTRGLLACRPSPNLKHQRLPTVSDYMEVVTTETGFEIQAKTSPEDLPLTSIAQEAGIPESPESITNQNSRELATKDISSSPESEPLLSVQHLRVGFRIANSWGRTKRLFMAVNDVSFEVFPGEILGLVGESGCGKSTLSRALLQLIPPLSGEVIFEGENITAPYPQRSWLGGFNNYRARQRYSRRMRWLRRDMQIIFQDPFSSLDPRMNVGEAIMEPMLIHQFGKTNRERQERAVYLLERVGLKPEFINRYPHEFSGGQRQRICIARSLALNPKFIICDESVSALDVSVQAQVLNLLKELQAEFGLTYIFISHDLGVVKFMSDRIMVMNQGKIEEIGQADDIYYRPQTQYTRQLIDSIPTGKLVS
ncbi:MAG: ABC transporter ATP-binding protein [Microcoleaceae cyanobacterium]